MVSLYERFSQVPSRLFAQVTHCAETEPLLKTVRHAGPEPSPPLKTPIPLFSTDTFMPPSLSLDRLDLELDPHLRKGEACHAETGPERAMSGNARLELFGNVLPPVAHVDLVAPEGVDLEGGGRREANVTKM